MTATDLDDLNLDVLNLDSFDTMNLVSLIRQLHERLRLLEARINILEATRAGGQHSGKQ